MRLLENIRRPRSLLVRAALAVLALQLIAALLTRFALLFQGMGDVDWGLSLASAFVLGFLYDALTGVYAAVPISLIVLLAPLMFWRSKAGMPVIAGLLGIYGVVFAFISVAEWFFWDEFQVRFNFIAVDYLVYTQEVLQNIRESYPLGLIFSGLATAGALVAAAVWKLGIAKWICEGEGGWRLRAGPLFAGAAVIAVSAMTVSQSLIPRFGNEYNRELAKNGIYSFCSAFWESEIDYERFYMKQPVNEAFARARKLLDTPESALAGTNPEDLRRQIKSEGPEHRWNVMLISVESLSAEFLDHFNTKPKGITPHLDKLCDEGILFSSLYATGTRTVRGLEALTLSLPPTPGQSIVWRPKNENLFSLGSIFRQRGYDTAYVYGGDAMFDNMSQFFSSNGYRVVDRMKKEDKDITFQNAWGVCDEDLMAWAGQEADAAHAQGKPFFLHVMTVSNHRPFTFPDGRIDLPSNSGRKAAVKYTDFAIGDFINKARSKPWFANTLFVIVADHCHGSAGKSEIDATKYRIPCIVWNPALVKPAECKRLCSQIDVGPTVLGLLGWSYTSRFFGEDVLRWTYTQERRRAFISNYQKIGFLRGGSLALLKPKQETTVGEVDLKTGAITAGEHPDLLSDAVALYQSAAWLFRNGHLGADTAKP